MGCFILSLFLMGTCLLSLGGEQLVFKLAHTSWWVYGIQFNILYGLDVVELEYISY
jgi:hypothetical protein